MWRLRATGPMAEAHGKISRVAASHNAEFLRHTPDRAEACAQWLFRIGIFPGRATQVCMRAQPMPDCALFLARLPGCVILHMPRPSTFLFSLFSCDLPTKASMREAISSWCACADHGVAARARMRDLIAPLSRHASERKRACESLQQLYQGDAP